MEGIDDNDGVDQEQMDARDAADEDNAAMIVDDFDDDAEQSMAMALTMAGASEERATIATCSINQRVPTQTDVDVYGRFIRDQSLVGT